MGKYRVLSNEELLTFKKEFIDYLVVNGLTAKDWEEIKIDELEKANQIIELFSDVIFERVFRKVTYLDFKSKNSLMSFQCLSDKMVLVSLDLKDDSINLLDVKVYNDMIISPPSNVKIYTSQKEYSLVREEELFKMVNSGCEISDGSLFKSLCLGLS
jgi:hypothetical protein